MPILRIVLVRESDALLETCGRCCGDGGVWLGPGPEMKSYAAFSLRGVRAHECLNPETR